MADEETLNRNGARQHSASGGRKEAIRTYKRRTPPRGIFLLRCRPSGEVWVGSAPDLESVGNKLRFCLRYRHHRNAPLQAAWDAHGEDAFDFSTLEKLDEETPPILVNDELKKRKAAWIARLGASAL